MLSACFEVKSQFRPKARNEVEGRKSEGKARREGKGEPTCRFTSFSPTFGFSEATGEKSIYASASERMRKQSFLFVTMVYTRYKQSFRTPKSKKEPVNIGRRKLETQNFPHIAMRNSVYANCWTYKISAYKGKQVEDANLRNFFCYQPLQRPM